MDEKHGCELKNAAVAYLQEYGILDKFQTMALNHSRNIWESFTPYEPLILDLEVDLRFVYYCSSDLYDKLVAYPAQGRLIFQGAIAESIRDYLRYKQSGGICCIQVLMRCAFYDKLKNATNLYAKNYSCLSYMKQYVLTSVTIPRSKKCNLATICVLSRCLNETCPGHAGRYLSMEELAGNDPLGYCSYCKNKCIEDPAGRGEVRRVMAKFMPAEAFNDREEESLHRSVTCSITEPLPKELELGDMYDLCGRYNFFTYEVWGLKRTSFFNSRPAIPLSPFPPSIRELLGSLGYLEPSNPWIFVRKLALELGSNIYRKKAAVSLKIGLLLSLATLGSERCAPILCVGPNIDIVEEDIMHFAANCADRSEFVTFPVSGSIVKDGDNIWLHSGSLLRAKTGVCNAGDWECLKTAQKNELLSVLDNGEITIEQKDKNKASGSANAECLPPPFPLKTAVWTRHTFFKHIGQKQIPQFEALIDAFGIPFLVDVEKNITAEDIHERFEIFLDSTKVNPRVVPREELTEFLRVINGIAVTLSEEAAKLIEDYFVTCRKLRGESFRARSISFMTTLAEAHARLSLRNKVTYDDVTAVIYFYEESMNFLYGPSISSVPHFKDDKIDDIDKHMEAFKTWLRTHLRSVVP